MTNQEIESKIKWMEDRLMALQKEVDELKALLNGDLNKMPRVDFGEAVSVKEKDALWSKDDEKRQEVVNQNGNDGHIYSVNMGGRGKGKTKGKTFTYGFGQNRGD